MVDRSGFRHSEDLQQAMASSLLCYWLSISAELHAMHHGGQSTRGCCTGGPASPSHLSCGADGAMPAADLRPVGRQLKTIHPAGDGAPEQDRLVGPQGQVRAPAAIREPLGQIAEGHQPVDPHCGGRSWRLHGVAWTRGAVQCGQGSLRNRYNALLQPATGYHEPADGKRYTKGNTVEALQVICSSSAHAAMAQQNHQAALGVPFFAGAATAEGLHAPVQ